MNPKIFIIIGIIAVIVFFIIKNNFTDEYKQQTKTLKSILKQPHKQLTDELTFLDKNYEKEKLKELKYLTSQHNSTDEDINSQDLL